MTDTLLVREVDGRKFFFPANKLHEFDFWFGTNNPFKSPMFTIYNGKVNYNEDTGMCGTQAIATRWVSVEQAMADKCNAKPLTENECEFCGEPATKVEQFDRPVPVCDACHAGDSP